METLAVVAVVAAFTLLAQNLGTGLAIVVALSGSAGAGGLIVALLTLRETKRQNIAKMQMDSNEQAAGARIDVLQLGQTSLAAALARADAEIATLHARLDDVEARERQCQETLRELMGQP